MQTMDESLMAHLQAGRISHHDALARAQDKAKFETPAQPQGHAAPAVPKAA
jgi:Tfp pilus assembly ATPase PilU